MPLATINPAFQLCLDLALPSMPEDQRGDFCDVPRGRKPVTDAYQSGGLFDLLADEHTREEDVSQATGRVSDPLPAGVDGRVEAGADTAKLSGRDGGDDESGQARDSGEDGKAAPTRNKPRTTENRSRPARARDVHAGQLDETAQFQCVGLFEYAAAQPVIHRPARPPKRTHTPRKPAAETEFSQAPLLFGGSEAPLPAPEPEPLTSRFALADAPPVPSGLVAKAEATLEAIRLLKTLEAEDRTATDAERQTLAQFSGLGSIANHIFPALSEPRYKSERWKELCDELEDLLTEDEYRYARRSTHNAFYTSPAVMQAMYDALAQMGVPDDSHALEPGCGIGNFAGYAPQGMHFTGVEQDKISGTDRAQALS